MPLFSQDDKTYGYIVSTGGGAGAANQLWSQPGISANFCGASFPYANTEVDQFIGYNIGKEYCSRRVAIELAIEAYLRAKTSAILQGKWDLECIGVSATATCASTRAHKGGNRVHFAAISDKHGMRYYYYDKLPSQVTESQGVGLEARILDGKFIDTHLVSFCRTTAVMDEIPEVEVQRYLLEHPVFKFGQRLTEWEGASCNSIYWFPGSFNPIHDGHLAMMRSIDQMYWKSRGKYMLELDISHPDKGNRKVIDILTRIAGIRAATVTSKMDISVIITKGCSYYIDKVKRNNLRGYSQNFIIGVDTLDRLLDPKWDIGTPQQLTDQFENYRVRFIVFPRDGLTKDNVIEKYNIKCDEQAPYVYAPQHYESKNISSTEIRKQRSELISNKSNEPNNNN